MPHKVIGKCPVCTHDLKVTRLSCDHCHTSLEGKFELDKFSTLSAEEKYFIEIFLKNRGNLKEMERDLGVSYPTVRRHLEQVIASLGYEKKEPKVEVDKKAVLARLAAGEITSEEALDQLKGYEK
jgi:hypothetical protein